MPSFWTERQHHWSHSCHNHLYCNISSVISDFNLPMTDAQANPCLTSTFRCLSQFETSFFAFQLLWDLTNCQYHAKGFIFSWKSSFQKWCAWFDEEEKWINESWMPVFSGNCAKSTIKLGVCLHCLYLVFIKWFHQRAFHFQNGKVSCSLSDLLSAAEHWNIWKLTLISCAVVTVWQKILWLFCLLLVCV